jgi:hypothetical protein
MKAKKITWTKKDNFLTIRKQILDLVGKDVVGRVDKYCTKKEISYTIFSVGEVHKTFIECTFSNEHDKRVEKYFSDSMSDTTGFGFPEPTKKPMWGYKVEFGHKGEDGRRMFWTYYFMIPRTNDYDDDLKKCTIMEDPNHPFIFYELK